MEKKILILVVSIVFALAVMLGLICLISKEQEGEQPVSRTDAAGDENSAEQSDEQEVQLQIDIDLRDYYSTNIGSSTQMYHIDEDGTLWGCGSNQYGQLGIGSTDYEFHQEMERIAEDVIHVDYSERGFAVFITGDHKLYGMGNAGSGALLEHADITVDSLKNGEHYTINSPRLLFENVVYANCGQNDVVCLLEDGSVWTWGTVWWYNFQFYAVPEPKKILENAVFITGGWYNHAALTGDGSVYTWGYNYAGNCGIADQNYISMPVKAATHAVMVWTGKTEFNTEITDITEFDYFEHDSMDVEDTIILKEDGTYWACGATIGEEKILQDYFETYQITRICTSSFVQIPDEKYFNEMRELAVSEKGDYQIRVVQRGNRRLRVSAESKSGSFKTAGILQETIEEMKPEDIEIIWTEGENLMTAEVRIAKRDKSIFDYKTNFMQGGAGDWEKCGGYDQ